MDQFITLHGGRIRKRPHSHSRGWDTHRKRSREYYERLKQRRYNQIFTDLGDSLPSNYCHLKISV